MIALRANMVRATGGWTGVPEIHPKALWANFESPSRRQGSKWSFLGIPSELITAMTAPLLEGTAVEYKTLGLRLEYISLSQVRTLHCAALRRTPC